MTNELKDILLAEDNANDVELTLAAPAPPEGNEPCATPAAA